MSGRLLNQQVSFEVLDPILQQRRARVLAKRAEVARSHGDQNEAICILCLGVAWLQLPVQAARGGGAASNPPACLVESQGWVCCAVADALETLDVSDPAVSDVAAPALEVLRELHRFAVEIGEQHAQIEWARIASRLGDIVPDAASRGQAAQLQSFGQEADFVRQYMRMAGKQPQAKVAAGRFIKQESCDAIVPSDEVPRAKRALTVDQASPYPCPVKGCAKHFKSKQAVGAHMHYMHAADADAAQS